MRKMIEIRNIRQHFVSFCVMLSLCASAGRFAYGEEASVGFLIFEPIYGEADINSEVVPPPPTLERVAVVSFVAAESEEQVRISCPGPSGENLIVPFTVETGKDRSISTFSTLSEFRQMNLQPLFGLGAYESSSFQSAFEVFCLRPRALIVREDDRRNISILAFITKEWASIFAEPSPPNPIFGVSHVDKKKESLRDLAAKIQKEPSVEDFCDFVSVVLTYYVGMTIENVKIDPHTLTVSFDLPSVSPEFELKVFYSHFEPLGGIKSAQQNEALKP